MPVAVGLVVVWPQRNRFVVETLLSPARNEVFCRTETISDKSIVPGMDFCFCSGLLVGLSCW